MLIANIGVPVKDNRQIIGFVGTAITLPVIQTIVEKIKLSAMVMRFCSARAVLSLPTTTRNGLERTCGSQK
ncbi:MAG: hypothetical protein LBB48_03435 [Treponema sp.]|nr:hypothetical protein [Treponema sp.]